MTTPTDPTTELAEITADLAAVAPMAYPDPPLVADAITHAVAALEPFTIGDHGLGRLVPTGYKLEVHDVNEFSDRRRPVLINRAVTFTDVPSLADYVNRYGTVDTLGYAHAPTTDLLRTLKATTDLVTYVIDEDPADAHSLIAAGTHNPLEHRAHRARLQLIPTPAARRWANVIGRPLTQTEIADVLTDGIGQIADPDGAHLRDLLTDLTAIRKATVREVNRNTAGTTVTVEENVDLHAGTGTAVTIPDALTLTFTPFTAVGDAPLIARLRLKPEISDKGTIAIVLTWPDADTEIGAAIAYIADTVANAIDRYPAPLNVTAAP